ncbi:MAG: glycosyltransferase family 39 protein [Gammaproteobacteria bacterium]|nr:glycosyltransferase family 39 protein [Gammaproteobacteria bacterium]
MTTTKSYILLTLLCLLLYLPGIVVLPITDRDAAHFAQATKQMLETGDYLEVKFQNRPRHLKPPGIYWLQALAVKLTRVKNLKSVWPYRLPSALGALLAVLMLFAGARRFVGEKAALLASAILASSLLLIIEAHLIVTDAMLLFTMVVMQLGLWRCYANYKEQHNDKWGFWLFWLGLSAGILIKGITPLVGVLTIIGLCCIERKFHWLKQIKPGRGLLLMLVLTLTWLLPLSLMGKSNFLMDMLRGDVAPKLVGGQEGHGLPPGFFVGILTLMFWPASLFLWQGIVWAWQQRRGFTGRFLIAWIIPSWLFFELVPTKLPQYVLPVYPALALLVALGILQLKSEYMPKIPRFLARLQYVLWTLYGLGLAVAVNLAPYLFWHKLSLMSLFAGAVIVLTIIIVWICLARSTWLRACIFAIAGTVLFMGSLYEIVLPSWQPIWVSQRLVKLIHNKVPGSISAKQPLLAVGYQEPSLVFLLGTHMVRGASLESAVNVLKKQKSSLVLVGQDQVKDLIRQCSYCNLHLVGKINGFNYSRSRKVSLALYQQ